MHIHTLIPDIQSVLKGHSNEWLIKTGETLAQTPLKESQAVPRLRLSQMGPKCPRALWYSIHHPELNEQLPPWAEFKYGFGHIIEAAALTLAKLAGHEVTGEQDEINLSGVLGHRDGVIDGCLVDVKSAATRSYQKFKDGSIRDNDDFGYLDQLDGYMVGSLQDPLVRVKDKAYLLAIDKQLGHMCLYEHQLREGPIRKRISEYQQIVALGSPPECTCVTEDDGESGNIKLGLRASYSAQKYSCFPFLRTFLFAGGVRYLTKVVRKPTWKGTPITEVDKHGKIVYN